VFEATDEVDFSTFQHYILSILGLRDAVLASIKLSALSLIFAGNKLKRLLWRLFNCLMAAWSAKDNE
jgi:hypothetical protein